MRRIVKTHPPQSLKDWCKENKNLNHAYNDMLGSEAHKELKARLLQEQGYICAYTGRFIEDKNSHIEHLKPRKECADWEDVDYKNLVACFPADGGDTSHGYGAPSKHGWWDEALFVSPLSKDCERKFKFAWSGHVRPNPDDHQGAKKTIDILGLDEEKLRQIRKSCINGFFGFGLRTQSRPLSIDDAKKLLANIEKFDGKGRLREFCFVLKQLLPKYIANGTKR